MYRRKQPLCRRDPYDPNPEGAVRGVFDDNTGGTVEKTNYPDGSSTVHWGGPAGDMHYDEFGEEC